MGKRKRKQKPSPEPEPAAAPAPSPPQPTVKPQLTPEEKKLRWHLQVKRTIRVAIYNVLAWGVAGGMLFFAVVALQQDVPPAYIVIIQIPLAAILAGLHKRLEFRGKEFGIDPPEVMLPPGGDVAGLVVGETQ